MATGSGRASTAAGIGDVEAPLEGIATGSGSRAGGSAVGAGAGIGAGTDAGTGIGAGAGTGAGPGSGATVSGEGMTGDVLAAALKPVPHFGQKRASGLQALPQATQARVAGGAIGATEGAAA